MNNLLMIVIGRVQLLLAGWNREDPRRSLEIVNQAAQDAAEVVRRVQQFSQEKHEGEPQLVDVNKLVGDALELTRFRWQDTANAQGIVIDSTFESSELPPVYGDTASLTSVSGRRASIHLPACCSGHTLPTEIPTQGLLAKAARGGTRPEPASHVS